MEITYSIAYESNLQHVEQTGLKEYTPHVKKKYVILSPLGGRSWDRIYGPVKLFLKGIRVRKG